MKFILEIDCDNAAFEDDPKHEIARILKETSAKVERDIHSALIRDANGNTVGDFRILFVE